MPVLVGRDWAIRLPLREECRIDRKAILRIQRLGEIQMARAMLCPIDLMKTKAISIRQREVRLILAQGPGRATDLSTADQHSRRPMKAPAALPMVPDLADLPEDHHPRWMEVPGQAQAARPEDPKKAPVPSVRPRARRCDRTVRMSRARSKRSGRAEKRG